MRPIPSLARRQFLLGTALAMTAWRLPPAWAQTASGDAPRALRMAKGPQGRFGFDGSVPGPLLRLPQGRPAAFRLTNELEEPASIDWYGIRMLRAGIGPEAASIAPGQSADIRFTPPDAGTFWYRTFGKPEDGGDRGLYGPLIVDARQPAEVDADVLLMFGDTATDARPVPRLVTVNGGGGADIAAKTNDRLRLRLINATASRAFGFQLARLACRVMAVDGQPAEPFPALEGRLTLGPGNRIDLFVDVTVESGTTIPLTLTEGASSWIAGRIVVGGAARKDPRSEPGPLPANPLPERIDLRASTKVPLNAETLFARETQTPLFTVRRGQPVTLTLVNPSARAVSVHLHGHSFRHLDRLDDGWKPYWLDSHVMAERSETRLAFVADNPGRWPVELRALGEPRLAARPWFEVN